MKILFPIPLVLAVLFAAGSLEAKTRVEPLKSEWWKGNDFSWVRGANYVPSYARNHVEQWIKFDPKIIERDLSFCPKLQLNSVRVFLNYIAWEKDPRKFNDDFETFLKICEKFQIRPMVVLFDGCFGGKPALESVTWVSNPGPELIKKQHRPKMSHYLKDVVGRHVGDPRILFWDIMNEPSSFGGGEADEVGGAETAYAFAKEMCEAVNKLDPTHPTTIGVGNWNHIDRISDVVDVVTYHNYTVFEKAYDMDIANARRLSAKVGKEVLITETSILGVSQNPAVTLRALHRNQIGWYVWELTVGKTPFSVTLGMITPEGKVREPGLLEALLNMETADSQWWVQHLDEKSLNAIVADVKANPSTEKTFQQRYDAWEAMGRGLGWSGIPEKDWGVPVAEVAKAYFETKKLWDDGKREEADVLLRKYLPLVAEISRKVGFLPAER